jgi:ABC-2 type transport system ATP-binding protein
MTARIDAIANNNGVKPSQHSISSDVSAGRGPTVLETENLSKTYGSRVALEGLNLSVRGGEVFGYIGPNGAGKTTTFRILAGLLDPSGGCARIEGHDVTRNPRRIKALVGYLPDNFGVYSQLTVREYLDFFAAAYGIGRNRRGERIDHCLEIANAAEFADNLMGALSRGMKQRVGIAKTLLHDPVVLILDEPAATIDPRARVQMRHLLRRLADSGKAVLVSSHILPELADVCDSIGFVVNGKMVCSGTVKEVLRKVRPTRIMEIKIIGDISTAEEALVRSQGEWRRIETEPQESGRSTILRYSVIADDAQLAASLKALMRSGVDVISFSEIQANLEDAFMHLTE